MKKNTSIIKNTMMLCGVLISHQLAAIEFEYSLFSAYRHSDNLTQNNLQLSGNALNAGGAFSFENDGDGNWTIDFSGSLSREWYSIDSLQRQDRNQVSAIIEYTSPSTNFEFLLRDDYSQAPRNRFAVEEVGNLVDVNVATARPSYFFNITPLDLIKAEVTYLDSSREGDDIDTFGEESFDFVNISKEIRYEKTLSNSSDVSLVFDSVETRFNEDSSGVDFDQDNLFIRWVGRGRLNQAQIEIGKSRVTDVGGEDFDTELFNFLYSRQINPDNTIGISLQNSVNLIVSESFIQDSINIDDQIGAFGNAQKVKSANVSYTMSGELISGDFQISNASYENLAGENREKRAGISLSVTYSLSKYFSTAPQTNVNLILQKNKNSFENELGSDIENDVELYSLQFNYYASESLSYYIQWLKRDASSNSPTSAFLSGDSNSISIGISFAPVPNR